MVGEGTAGGAIDNLKFVLHKTTWCLFLNFEHEVRQAWRDGESTHQFVLFVKKDSKSKSKDSVPQQIKQQDIC